MHSEKEENKMTEKKFKEWLELWVKGLISTKTLFKKAKKLK